MSSQWWIDLIWRVAAPWMPLGPNGCRYQPPRPAYRPSPGLLESAGVRIASAPSSVRARLDARRDPAHNEAFPPRAMGRRAMHCEAAELLQLSVSRHRVQNTRRRLPRPERRPDPRVGSRPG